MCTLKKTEHGFTLIEIVIVIAILGIILAYGMINSLGTYNSDNFETEQSKIVSILERARSQAMANMFESDYGVCYVAPNYVIFRGNACIASSTSEITPANINIATNSNFSTTFPVVIFNQLDGKVTPQLIPASTEQDILITDGTKTAHIKINNEGTINW